jgi:hypothetical protein
VVWASVGSSGRWCSCRCIPRMFAHTEPVILASLSYLCAELFHVSGEGECILFLWKLQVSKDVYGCQWTHTTATQKHTQRTNTNTLATRHIEGLIDDDLIRMLGYILASIFERILSHFLSLYKYIYIYIYDMCVCVRVSKSSVRHINIVIYINTYLYISSDIYISIYIYIGDQYGRSGTRH